MELEQITFLGSAIDDPQILQYVPIDFQSLLERMNGFILYGGGLHVRGACCEPKWHSLRWAMQSHEAFHLRYPAVSSRDIPFGQDCVGDQFLLRNDLVMKLFTETGETEELNITIEEFLQEVQADPVTILGLAPLVEFHREGGVLLPGQLLNVYPPFSAEEASDGVSIAAVPSQERLYFLAELSRQLQNGD